MTGPDDFDDHLATAATAALEALRREFERHCELVAAGHRGLPWTGRAHDQWSDQVRGCLAEGLDAVDAIAAAITHVEATRARAWSHARRGPGPTP